ncbi:MAG: anaerobic ribonucleoside-triphosphate reductase activating protein [Firmicutes bacterium]|nr:anaerobic ribonucleoside-triphosphate reductase activating protein [Bacillota bacterium]
MKIRIFGIDPESIVDGPGFRYALFVQGCKMNCPGCHNPASHDITGGTEFDTEDILKAFEENPLLAGVTFSGGEPMLWAAELADTAQKVRAMGKNVWVYTGYTFEELLAEAAPGRMALLQNTDVLVDGRFEQEKRSLELKFRGSSNQRLIDVKKSLADGCVTEWK